MGQPAGGLPVALDRAVEGGWSRVIYTYSLTTLSEIQTMTYTDQGQVESDPHLVTSSPPPLPPTAASLGPQADSERQTCLTYTPTSLVRCRYGDMHSRPHTQLCLDAHPETPRQLCSQTHTQRWSHLWRESLTVTHRSTTSWQTLDTQMDTQPHTQRHATNTQATDVGPGKLHHGCFRDSPCSTHTFIHSINPPIF